MTTFTIDRTALDTAKANIKPVDLSGINFGLLDLLELWATREWDKKEKGLPSEWEQGTWMTMRGEEVTGTACGTACCLAGKAVAITPGAQVLAYEYGDFGDEYTPITNMAEFEPSPNGYRSFDYVTLPQSLITDDVETSLVTDVNGNDIERVSFNEAGRAILGLNKREAQDLFAGTNKLRDVQRIVAKIKSGYYRVETESVNVPIVPVNRCGQDSNEYVSGIMPDAYTRWGRCVLGDHDDTVEHLFSDL